MAMLIVSTGVEMFIIVRDWLQGVAYRDIVASYREYYPELLAYAIPQQRWALFATLVIDMLGYLPYYSALLCGAGLFINSSAATCGIATIWCCCRSLASC